MWGIIKIISKKLTSRGALVCILIGIISLFLIFIYAVYRDAEIIMSRDGLVSIIPKGSDRIKQLEQLLSQSVSEDEYKRLDGRFKNLENENRIERSRVSRLLAVAGVDLSESEDTAIRKLEMLAVRSKGVERDMTVSLSVIRVEVMLGRTINTNSLAMDETRLGLYMDIQKFLRCLGIYNGEIDGEQVSTCRAVKKFQKKYGLKDDGIIGQKTLAAMEKAFEQAKSY